MSVADSLNRLAKWRNVLAGWQVGTVAKDEPGVAAIRDHRELTLILRAEVTTLVGILVEKGVVSLEEWSDRLDVEAQRLDANMEERFPGFRSDDNGIHMDLQQAAETMRRLGFPP